MFKLEGSTIVNEKGKVWDVQGGVDGENKNVMVNNNDGKINQQWDVIYTDEYKAEPVKGELNERFGLYVERDFYVISTLSSGRYLDVVNNRNFAIKTRNGRKT